MTPHHKKCHNAACCHLLPVDSLRPDVTTITEAGARPLQQCSSLCYYACNLFGILLVSVGKLKVSDIAQIVQVAENGDLRFMSGRAQVIDELETTIPVWLRHRNPQWYPKFVHILTVRLGLGTVYHG